MTLAAGNKLGPYEIIAPLGAAVMGEVHRDPKLANVKITAEDTVKVWCFPVGSGGARKATQTPSRNENQFRPEVESLPAIWRYPLLVRFQRSGCILWRTAKRSDTPRAGSPYSRPPWPTT
jgi:hypothetical protein